MENIQFEFQQTWNDGLGFIPVSLFVKLGVGKEYTLEDAYETLGEHECMDIIFLGELKDWAVMDYLIPRLRSDGKFVHVYANLIRALTIKATRRIIPVDMQTIRKLENVIAANTEAGTLTEHDVFIIMDDDIGRLKMTRKKLMENSKSIIFFHTRKMIPQKVLDEGIYDIIPYRGGMV